MEDVFQGWNLRMSPFPSCRPLRRSHQRLLLPPLCSAPAFHCQTHSFSFPPRPSGYQVCFGGEGGSRKGDRDEEGWHKRGGELGGQIFAPVRDENSQTDREGRIKRWQGGGNIEQTSPSWPVAAPDPSSLNSVPAAGVVKRPFYE